MSQLSSVQGIIRFGDFRVDLHSGELRKNGTRIKLQVQPFQVLQILLEHPGEVVTREELQKRIWPADTFVDFDHGLNNAIKKLREALADDAENPKFVATLPRRGYRFIGALSDGDASIGHSPREAQKVEALSGRAKLWKVMFPAALVLVGLSSAGYFYFHRAPKLTEKDTIVLGDFINSTGDRVFDESLKRALAVSLQQSPFLSLLSDQQIRQTLRLMGRPPDTKLSQDITREVCQRNQAKATIGGTISALGSQYLITLDAINCATAASLTRVGANATSKEKVLQALGQAASELRKRLGESLTSVEKYDAPLEQATTSSMEALRMYSLGLKAYGEEGSSACIPYFRRAIELDPNFASAYAFAAVASWNVGESSLASEYVKHAYQLRDRVTELERLFIETLQSSFVSGDLVKDEEAAELLKRTYPRYVLGFIDAAADKQFRGDYLGSIQDSERSLQIAPSHYAAVANLSLAYMSLGRLDEAKKVLDQGLANGIDPAALAQEYYYWAFLRNETNVMKKQVALTMGKAGYEDVMLSAQSDTEAYHGRLKQSREYSRRATESAEHHATKEAAATWVAIEAMREAEFDNFAEAHRSAALAMQLAPNARYTRCAAGLALAMAGHATRARKVADALAREFPEDTIVNSYWLPMVRASIELRQRNPGKAIELLRATQAYELGEANLWMAPLVALRLRGHAFLGSGQGEEAIAEFQRILDRPGIALNTPVGPLAQLGLARAFSLAGQTSKGRAAYETFFALWKDADPDIPVLKQAKAEYAKLQ